MLDAESDVAVLIEGVKIPKADRYKTVSLKTTDIDVAPVR